MSHFCVYPGGKLPTRKAVAAHLWPPDLRKSPSLPLCSVTVFSSFFRPVCTHLSPLSCLWLCTLHPINTCTAHLRPSGTLRLCFGHFICVMRCGPLSFFCGMECAKRAKMDFLLLFSFCRCVVQVLPRPSGIFPTDFDIGFSSSLFTRCDKNVVQLHQSNVFVPYGQVQTGSS